jgi:hypothetical protein
VGLVIEDVTFCDILFLFTARLPRRAPAHQDINNLNHEAYLSKIPGGPLIFLKAGTHFDSSRNQPFNKPNGNSNDIQRTFAQHDRIVGRIFGQKNHVISPFPLRNCPSPAMLRFFYVFALMLPFRFLQYKC